MALLLFVIGSLLLGLSNAVDLPTASLLDGQSLRITVESPLRYDGVRFFVCDDSKSNCSMLWIADTTDGGLRYTSWVDCESVDFPCTSVDDVEPSEYRYSHFDGEVVFIATLQSNALVIRMEDKPDKIAVGPIPANARMIIVTPETDNFDFDSDWSATFSNPIDDLTTDAPRPSTGYTSGPTATAIPSAPTTAPASTSAPASTTAPDWPSWPPLPVPTQCPERADLRIPDPERDDQYIVCFGGRSQVMPCPPSLVFNYRCQVCDWTSDGRC